MATGVRGSGSRGGNAGKALLSFTPSFVVNSDAQLLPCAGACYDFQRGQCSRGGSCKFSHDGEDRNGSGGGTYVNYLVSSRIMSQHHVGKLHRGFIVV